MACKSCGAGDTVFGIFDQNGVCQDYCRSCGWKLIRATAARGDA